MTAHDAAVERARRERREALAEFIRTTNEGEK